MLNGTAIESSRVDERKKNKKKKTTEMYKSNNNTLHRGTYGLLAHLNASLINEERQPRQQFRERRVREKKITQIKDEHRRHGNAAGSLIPR